MKIALLTDGIYPYVIGGMQKHSFYLAKYFAFHGIQVDLYHTNKSSLDIDLLEVFSDEEKKQITSYVVNFPEEDKFPGHYLRASRKYATKVFDLFKLHSTDADFIYVKGFAGWKLIEEKKKGFICGPVGVNFHGYEMFQKAPDFKSLMQQLFLFRKPVKYNVKNADYLFSYGGKITQILKTIINDHHKIIEIPTGIEADWLCFSNDKVHSPLRFVFIGRNERRKGIIELNNVLRQILPLYDFEFRFIGPITEEEQIKSSRISYIGIVADTSIIRKILQDCDVLVCPSHSEGMPNVIMEGMASGLAVIASNVGAVMNMVGPDNGILTTPGDEITLKRALINILVMNDTELKKLKQQSVLKTQQHFLWENIIKRTIDAIKKASEGYRS